MSEADGEFNPQRERIRLVAVQLFTRRGFAGTSMKELAKALDMAPGNLYNYFPNKESILFDVLEHQLVALKERNAAIVEREAPATEILRELATDLVAHDLEDPLAAFVGIQGVRGLTDEHLTHISGLMADIRATWTSVISRGAESGEFDIADVKLCALSVLTLCSSVSTWYRRDGAYSVPYIAESIGDMALRMAGCRQESVAESRSEAQEARSTAV